ncbi:restriction endonuclease fold toxin-2 domain-containing protein [Streptomyces sp. NPDC059142]|uniref:restriction endonuclease fold toxin-2 domain-containing protein n=1 Tax=Streptomyces sp. NPDC059142 TaxID=3346739 RepID=UPI0036B62FD4
MSELPPDLKFIAEGMIRGSMGLVETMRGVRDSAIGAFHELDRQKGMAGDDDAGRAFAKVYAPAARTTLNQIGFGAHVLGATSGGLMRTAREFMAQENATVSAFLGGQADLSVGMGDPGEDCPENYLGLGNELPEVVGDTAWYSQYAPGGGSERFRGSPEKLRDVAGTWRHVGTLLDRFLGDAQTYASTADKAHSGEAADAFRTYFKNCVGFTGPPAQAQQDEPLVANLVAASQELAKACDRYAEHVEAALWKIREHRLDLMAVDMPWDSPMFGGNGFDGGLHDAVLEDPWIHRLGDVAHALDSSEGRVKLPEGSGDPRAPGLPLLPLIPAPVPVPLVLASYQGGLPGVLPMGQGVDPGIPSRDPIPPDPASGHRILPPAEQTRFRTWMRTLNGGGFAGGGGAANPDNAYQLRIAGYPERELPLPAGATGRSGKGLMADGLRPEDGYAVEAKHVREPDCKKTFRSLGEVDRTLATPPKVDNQGKLRFDPRVDGMYGSDERELARYRAAMSDPRNSEIRGLEIVTNDKDSAGYWQSMMAMNSVKGTSRYIP